MVKPVTGEKRQVAATPDAPRSQGTVEWIKQLFWSFAEYYFGVARFDHSVTIIETPEIVDQTTFDQYVNSYQQKIASLEERVTVIPTNKEEMAVIWQLYRQLIGMKRVIIENQGLSENITQIPTLNERVDGIYKTIHPWYRCPDLPPGKVSLGPRVGPGFSNPGENNCFINSLLQLLFGDEELLEMFLSTEYIDGEKISSIVKKKSNESEEIITKYKDLWEKDKLKIQDYKDGIHGCIWEYLEALRKKDQTTLTIGHEMRAVLQLIVSTKDGSKTVNFNNGRQHDASEVLQYLVKVLDLAKTPALSPKIKKTLYLEQNKEKDPTYAPQFPIQIEIRPGPNSSYAIESQLENFLIERNCSNEVRVDENGPNYKIEKAVQQFTERPEYLFLQFKRFDNDLNKIKSLIFLDQTFFLDNKHVASKEGGGEYQVRGFVVHSGSFSGGHYFTYRRVGNKWYLFNDSSVSEANPNSKEFQKDLHSCYILFAKRIDNKLTKKEIADGARENILKFRDLSTEAIIKMATKPEHDWQSELLPLRKELNLLPHFIKELKKDKPSEKALEKYFKAMPESFQDFIRNELILGKEKKFAELKDVEFQLTGKLKENIIEQYQWIREQRNFHAQERIKTLKYELMALEHLNKAKNEQFTFLAMVFGLNIAKKAVATQIEQITQLLKQATELEEEKKDLRKKEETLHATIQSTSTLA